MNVHRTFNLSILYQHTSIPHNTQQTKQNQMSRMDVSCFGESQLVHMDARHSRRDQKGARSTSLLQAMVEFVGEAPFARTPVDGATDITADFVRERLGQERGARARRECWSGLMLPEHARQEEETSLWHQPTQEALEAMRDEAVRVEAARIARGCGVRLAAEDSTLAAKVRTSTLD